MKILPGSPQQGPSSPGSFIADAARRFRRCTSLVRRLAVLLVVAAATTAGATAGDGGFAGTPVCAECHSEEHAQWQGSHHDLAMQRPTDSSVLGDFDDATFVHFGVTSTFFKRDGKFWVRTDGPDGELQDFPVEWVFGVYPLQQYLLPLDRGRLQALSIAWDSRREDEGGQRWYHLYPQEAMPHDDPLHWTGPYLNWNTRCAECHSTDVRKNYDAGTRSFATTFREDDVGCEACHGPGAAHVERARAGTLEGAKHGAFPLSLAARGRWVFDEDAPIARRSDPADTQPVLDTCGRCHARRGTLGDAYQYGRPFADTHRLSLLGEPLYHHDGQILDEVYVYGSFLQSRMYQAGVVCADCHEPHSTALRADGNGVCSQCHRASVFDATEHHGHPATSPGAQCVNCHMPETTYMGVDARRDHSMAIPRPDLSITIGTPNACTGCHEDKSADWALESLRERGVEFRDTSRHRAAVMAAVHGGDTRAVPALAELAADPQSPAIWRATALEGAATMGDGNALRLAQTLLTSGDSLLRVSAVRSLQTLPVQQRFGLLRPLMEDPVLGVRMEVAVGLADVPLGELRDEDRTALLALFDEYRRTQAEHADMPSIQLQLGLFHLARGDLPAAEAAYREALHLNPQLVLAHLNLADLLRATQRDDEAREQLHTTLGIAPDNADAMHALGLLETRARQWDEALRWLGRAAELEQGGSRYRFVYAIALHDLGDPAKALVVLQRLHQELPGDEQVLVALARYSAEAGNRDAARRYMARLLQLAPNNPQYRRMAEFLGS